MERHIDEQRNRVRGDRVDGSRLLNDWTMRALLSEGGTFVLQSEHPVTRARREDNPLVLAKAV